MQFFEYNEKKQRGSTEFPIEYYYIDETYPQYHMPLHWHEEYEIIHIIEGTFLIRLNGKEFRLKKGMLCIVFDGVLHGGTPMNQKGEPACIYECVVFHMNMLRNRGYASDYFLQKLVHHQLLLSPVIDSTDERCGFFVAQLFTSIRWKKAGYELMTQSALLGLFGMLEQEKRYSASMDSYYPASQKTEQLKKALELIEHNYDTVLTLQQMSKACGLSPKYFCRFFREMTHTTPMNYLNQYRIERACHFIAAKQLSLIDVSLACGFNDFSYFIRVFKRYKGITPKKFSLVQCYP